MLVVCGLVALFENQDGGFVRGQQKRGDKSFQNFFYIVGSKMDQTNWNSWSYNFLLTFLSWIVLFFFIYIDSTVPYQNLYKATVVA